jgi:hypothetical protein
MTDPQKFENVKIEASSKQVLECGSNTVETCVAEKTSDPGLRLSDTLRPQTV